MGVQEPVTRPSSPSQEESKRLCRQEPKACVAAAALIWSRMCLFLVFVCCHLYLSSLLFDPCSSSGASHCACSCRPPPKVRRWRAGAALTSAYLLPNHQTDVSDLLVRTQDPWREKHSWRALGRIFAGPLSRHACASHSCGPSVPYVRRSAVSPASRASTAVALLSSRVMSWFWFWFWLVQVLGARGCRLFPLA